MHAIIIPGLWTSWRPFFLTGLRGWRGRPIFQAIIVSLSRHILGQLRAPLRFTNRTTSSPINASLLDTKLPRAFSSFTLFFFFFGLPFVCEWWPSSHAESPRRKPSPSSQVWEPSLSLSPFSLPCSILPPSLMAFYNLLLLPNPRSASDRLHRRFSSSGWGSSYSPISVELPESNPRSLISESCFWWIPEVDILLDTGTQVGVTRAETLITTRETPIRSSSMCRGIMRRVSSSSTFREIMCQIGIRWEAIRDLAK